MQAEGRNGAPGGGTGAGHPSRPFRFARATRPVKGRESGNGAPYAIAMPACGGEMERGKTPSPHQHPGHVVKRIHQPVNRAIAGRW
jgi:hypothetical protein